MRSDHIKYFLAVAENHSLTKTSQEFYTTHQNVSKAIRQLEEELDAPLFERSQRGMVLTPAGKAFLPAAKQATEAFDAARLEIARITSNQELEGECRFYSSPLVSSSVLPGLLERFSNLHPLVTYHVDETGVLDVLRALSLHRSAFGFVTIARNPDFRSIYDPYFEQTQLTPIAQDQFFAIVSKDSPLAKQKKLAKEDLSDHNFVMLRSTSSVMTDDPLTQIIEQKLHAKISLFTANMLLYVQSITSGRYIGISSHRAHYDNDILEKGDTVAIPFETDMTIDIMLVRNIYPTLNTLDQAFVDMVLKQSGKTI